MFNTSFNFIKKIKRNLFPFYKNKEIQSIMPIIIKETDIHHKEEKNISFENLLKLAMNYLDKDSSNLAR